MVSHCRCPCRPPPRRPHPPRGAGWWWWGRRRRRAPHLARAPHCCSRPCCHLVIMPVPLLVVPLIVVDVSPWHWPWTSRHCCCHCVDAGRVVGSPSIVLSSLSCPSLSLLSPLPSSSLSRRCPPRLPLVVVVTVVVRGQGDDGGGGTWSIGICTGKPAGIRALTRTRTCADPYPPTHGYFWSRVP